MSISVFASGLNSRFELPGVAFSYKNLVIEVDTCFSFAVFFTRNTRNQPAREKTQVYSILERILKKESESESESGVGSRSPFLRSRSRSRSRMSDLESESESGKSFSDSDALCTNAVHRRRI